MNAPFFLREQTNLRRKRWILAGVGLVLCFLCWSILSYSRLIQPFFLPNPTLVFDASIRLWNNFHLWNDIQTSVIRVLIGFGLATILAVPLGMILALETTAGAMIEPILSFFRYVPPSALLPLLLLWFGIGELSKILLICFGVLPYVSFMTYDVVKNTRSELIDVAYSLGAANRQIFWKVILPSALPGIWDTLRINIGAAWTFVVLAEIIASTKGLGYLINTSQHFVQTDNVIAALIIIGIIGLLTDGFFRLTYKIMFPWMKKSHATYS